MSVTTDTNAGAAISSIGTALPRQRVSNEWLGNRLGVSPEWIESRTGIKERRVLADGERLTDLASEAVRRALELAGVEPGDVDLVLAATTTADELTPGLAPLVAHAIGARNAGTIDIGAACSGFLSALVIGGAWIETGRAGTIVVLGADAITRLTNPTDKQTAPLFGDGAGAVVLRRVAAPRTFGPVYLRSDGAGLTSLSVRRGAFLEMSGRDVFENAVRRMGEATRMACDGAGVTLDEVDLFVYHQANARILRALIDKLGLDSARVVDCIAKCGNTSAASIPLALEAASKQKRLHEGARVLIAAFGAGYAWGGIVIEWRSA